MFNANLTTSPRPSGACRPLGAIALVATAFGLFACSGDNSDKDTETGHTGHEHDAAVWEQVDSAPTDRFLSAVWGSGPDDVFVVGGNELGYVLHFDGTTWQEQALPADTPLLVWVYGFGPDDVYAVGLDGAAVRYDGTSWTTMPSTGTEEDLWGVFGHSPDDLWVVGGDPDSGADGIPNVLHWDGSSWESRPIEPAELAVKTPTTLFKVWGVASDVYIVGQNGEILKLDTTTGNFLHQSAGVEANQDFVSLWGTSPEQLVAVGGRSSGRIATNNGDGWETFSPGTPGLNGVQMLDSSTAFIVGQNGTAGTYNVDTNTWTAESTGSPLELHGTWFDGVDTVYTVGGLWQPPSYVGTLLKRTTP